MNTRDIKTFLHESIENINDQTLLLAIKEILERQYTPQESFIPTKSQLERIEQSKRQIEEGDFYTEKEADDYIDKWLNE